MYVVCGGPLSSSEDVAAAQSPPPPPSTSAEGAGSAEKGEKKTKKRVKKKGMKKHLMVMWGLGAAAMVCGLGYLFWQLRMSSGKKVCAHVYIHIIAHARASDHTPQRFWCTVLSK